MNDPNSPNNPNNSPNNSIISLNNPNNLLSGYGLGFDQSLFLRKTYSNSNSSFSRQNSSQHSQNSFISAAEQKMHADLGIYIYIHTL